MLKLARAITRFNRWIGRVTAWLVMPMFILLISAVTMRYLVGRPAVWMSELTQLIFGIYAVVGGGYLLAERAHVNVDIIYGKLSPRARAIIDVITSVLFFMFLAVLLWQGSSLAFDSAMKLETSQSVWNPPVWPVKLAVPIAGLLLLLQGFVRLASDIRVIMGLPNDEETFGKQTTTDTAH